jgi:hypothetical protein
MADLLHQQQGLVSRRQVIACGQDDAFLVRSLRRRELARVYDGVYVNHTGPLSWMQRAWAGVLVYWPAALSHDSVLRLNDLRRGPGGDEPIHITVDHSRRVSRRPGIELHRARNLGVLVQSSREPARLRLEHSLLEVLDDVATGAYSLLEHRYLTRVERPHGLPTAERQRRVSIGRSVAYRDVEYLGLTTLIELDGRLGHEEANDRWADLDRDLDSVGEGMTTMRLGWKQVEQPCQSAAAGAAMLLLKGWTEVPKPCLPGCPVSSIRGVNATACDESSPQARPRSA